MRQRRTPRGLTVTLCFACLMLGLVACAGTSATESPALTASVSASPTTTPIPPTGTLAPSSPTAIPAPPTDTVALASPTVHEPTDQGISTPEAPTQESVPTRAEVETEKPTTVPSVRPAETTPTGSEADRMVAAAKAALAARLGLSEAEITVQSVEPVEWPDTSLGCPQPGMMYAQMITPGYRVLLEADGKTYEYHTDGVQNAVLCEEESMADGPVVPVTVETGVERQVFQARVDLARRLSVEEDQIKILEVRAVTWPDASLGCPQEGMVYAQVLQEGLLIRLGVGGRLYFYHSSETSDPFLCEQSLLAPQVTPKDELLPPPGSGTD